jgi:hypothetical protein
LILDHFTGTADAGPQSIGQIVEATKVDRGLYNKATTAIG